jgi:hypothetical protein
MECVPAEFAAGLAQLTCVVAPQSILVPIVSLTTAMLAAWLAWQSIENARDIARRKATLDLIEKAESSDHYRQLVDSFGVIMREALLCHLIDKSASELAPERAALIDYLNHYELVSIGIRNNVLDQDMYRLWMQTAFIDTWNDVAPWVQAIRMRNRNPVDPTAYNPKAYEHFGALAQRWSPNAAILTAQGPAPLQQTIFSDYQKIERVRAARPTKS